MKKKDVVDSVKAFLEHSTVGDFENRMDMVRVVLRLLEEKGFTEENLVCVLWNLLMYYSQFVPIVGAYRGEQKKPIEKELKDYVKIAKWNDINFYAMKQAVDKSHRTLNKFVRKYEELLHEPIAQFLKDPKSVAQIPSFGEKKFHIVLPEHVLDECAPMVELSEETYVGRVDQLAGKMKKHIAKVVKQADYGSLLETLDGFTGDVISSIKDLRDEDILKLPKEKQKSARNFLQQRKRKALASLFKELKTMGVSYRKGMSMIDSNPSSSRDLPKLEPSQPCGVKSVVDLAGMLSSSSECFYKCQAKQSLFFNSLCSPSKEVGPREVERFKGLTEHLLSVACDQREQLATLLSSRHKLGTFISCMVEMMEEEQSQVCQIYFHQKISKF